MIELKEQPDEQTLLTVEQVARRLNTETYNVNRWIREGLLPAYKVGREWRVALADLEEYLRKNRRS